MRRLLALPLAFVLVACVPELHGECVADVDCPEGTACISGLCLVGERPPTDGGHEPDAGVHPDGGSEPDGGDVSCQPACAMDFHCEAASCVPDFAPEVTITAPAAQARVGGATLNVTVTARAPGGVVKLDVELLQGTTRITRATARTANAANTWEATLDLANAPSGDLLVGAALSWGSGELVNATPVPVVVDRDGPQITATPTPPVRSSGHPAENRFLRTDTITVDATITDAAGLAASAPTMELGGQTVNGTSTGTNTWRFMVPATAVPLTGVEGSVSGIVRATDALGNAGQASVAVLLSRRTWTLPAAGAAIDAAPAIGGTLLIVGDVSGKVRAIDRTTGVVAWEVSLGAAIVGHVALGSATAADGKGPFAYVVTAQGHAHWIDTRPGLTAAERLVFSCPGAGDGGQARAPAGGPAIGHTIVSKDDATVEETLFVQARGGHLQMMRRSPLPLPISGVPFGCMREWSLAGNYVNTVPALAPSASGIDVYVADDAGKVRKSTITRNALTGEFVHASGWNAAYDAGDPVLAPIALSQLGGIVTLFVGNSTGRLRVVDETRRVVVNTNGKVVGDRIDASPAVTGGFAWVVDRLGEGQKVTDATSTKAWTPAFKATARSTSAEAGIVVTSDGRTFIATGSKLSAVSSAGAVAWTFDAAPATVDGVTPALACDGTLFVVTNGTAGGGIEAIQTDTTGLATDGWPRPFHDARNTSNLAGPLATTGVCRD